MKHDRDRTRVAVIAASRAAMRRDHRLDVLAAIAAHGDQVVFAQGLARDLGVNDNQVAPELAMLREIGAVVEMPSESERQRFHQAVPHPIWTFAPAMLYAVIAAHSRGNVDAAVRRYVREQYAIDEPAPSFLASLAQGEGALKHPQT